MWKSILYKEWLKLKWIFLIVTITGIAAIISIFLNVKHDILFGGATNYWYSFLFMGLQYYQVVKYLPLAIGIAIGVGQYFPETVNKRIKLSFHLPVNEDKILITMMLCGTFTLLLTLGSMFMLFWGLSVHYFPAEIVHAAVITVTPWFLAGFVIYYFISLIVLEPVWKYWIFYALIGYSFVSLFLESSIAGGYEPVIYKLTILTLLLSLSLLFSAYRFRKGEM
ncbi:MAG: hypothetical protein WCK18_05070 [Prolixibacteraceae bacterium]